MNATLQTMITDTIRESANTEETTSLDVHGFDFASVLLAAEIAAERLGFFGGVWHGSPDGSVVRFADWTEGRWCFVVYF